VFQQDANYWRVGEVVQGSPAEAAKLQANDKIVSVDGRPIQNSEEFRSIVSTRAGQELTLTIDRGGQMVTTTVTPKDENGVGRVGIIISSFPEREKVGVLTASARAVSEFGSGVRESMSALGRFFSPTGISNFASDVAHGGSPTVAPDGQSGPNGTEPSTNRDRPVSIIGAANIGSDLTSEGLYGFLGFFATINLFIGIVNLAPLLPLDGGHVIIATYERIRSRRGRRYQVDVTKLLPLTYAVVMMLALLFVSTLFLDIVDPIRLN
jgi:membrane-associated protease RseP (regulator of RpoE activity)